MKMTFVESGIIAQGKYPDFVQYPDTSGQVMYIQDGKLFGDPVSPLDGEFSAPQTLPAKRMTRDTGINTLEFKTISALGIIGSYQYKTAHRLVICRYPDLMDKVFD